MKKQVIELNKNKSSVFKEISPRSFDKIQNKQPNIKIFSKIQEGSIYEQDPRKQLNISRNKNRSLSKKCNISTNVNTLHSTKSSHNIYSTAKVNREYQNNSFKNRSNQPLNNSSIAFSDFDNQKLNSFNNTIEIINIIEKFRSELDFSTPCSEVLDYVLKSSSHLSSSLYIINQLNQIQNDKIDEEINILSSRRNQEYKRIINDCKFFLDKIKEMIDIIIFYNESSINSGNDYIERNKMIEQIYNINLKDFHQLTAKEKLNLFLKINKIQSDFSSTNDFENTQQEKIGEENTSQDLDINLMLDITDRIKILPRSKINSVRMEKLKLITNSPSPRHSPSEIK